MANCMKGRNVRRNWRILSAGLMASCLMFAAAAGRAQEAANLVRNGDAELGTTENWAKRMEVRSEGAHAGKSCFAIFNSDMIMSGDLIPIDPNKTYVLSGWFKSIGPEPSQAYLGYAPYDAEKKPIYPQHVQPMGGTETKLAEACKKEDLLLKVADGSKWQLSPNICVAFEVDDSGKLKDLPNRNTSGGGVAAVENKGEYWEVKLTKACGLEYPAGTLIREHSSGPSYIYNAASSVTVPAEWTQYSNRIKGTAPAGLPMTQWWAGTRYARILLLTNYGQDAKHGMLMDDISMTELKE